MKSKFLVGLSVTVCVVALFDCKALMKPTMAVAEERK